MDRINGVFANHAAIALSNLSADDSNHDMIFDLGGLQAMLKLVRSASVEKQQCACFALGNLARHMRCRNSIIQSGGVGAIVRLLMSSNEMIAQQAAFTLAFLSKDPKVAEQIASPSGLDMSIIGENESAGSPANPSTPTKPSSANPSTPTKSPAASSGSEEGMDEECAIPALPSSPMAAIVRLLYSSYPEVITLGVTILMNICGENSSNWGSFVQHGGVHPLCLLLASQNKMAQRRAAEELSRLSTDPSHLADLLEPNHLALVIGLLVSPELDLRMAISGAAAQISAKPAAWRALVEQGGLFSFLELLSIDDLHTQTDAATALANLSECEEVLAKIGQSGIISRLIDLLYSTNLTLQSYAARILANLVRDPANAHQVVDCNGIHVFVDLIASTSVVIQESAAVALGRLAHFDQCRAAILSANKLPGVLSLLLASTSLAVQSTAVLLVGILSREPSFAPIISSAGIIKPLVSLITIHSASSSSPKPNTSETPPPSQFTGGEPSQLSAAAASEEPPGTPTREPHPHPQVTQQPSPNRFDRSHLPVDLPPSFEEAIVASTQPDPAVWALREDAARTILILASSGFLGNKTAIFQAGGLSALLALTQDKNASLSLQETSLACIAQMMSSHAVKKSFRELGGVQLLRNWLQNPDLHRFLSLLILHLSLDSLASASMGATGVVQALLQILSTSSDREVVLNILQSLSSLMLSMGNQEIFRTQGGWSTLSQFCTFDDPEVRLLCSTLVRTLTVSGTAHSEHILATGIISLILDLLGSCEVELVQINLLEALLNLLHSDLIRPHIVQLITLSDTLVKVAHQPSSISTQYLANQVLSYVF